MIREVKEELGIDINKFRLLDKYELKNNVMNVYVHDDNNFDETTIELNEEHTEYKFFTYYEVQNNSINFVPTNTQILLDYIRTQS